MTLSEIHQKLRGYIENEGHKLAEHDWYRTDAKQRFRQISFFPEYEEEGNQLRHLHYELFLWEGHVLIEIHPEGSIEFKAIVERVFDKIRLPQQFEFFDHPHGTENPSKHKGEFRKIRFRKKHWLSASLTDDQLISQLGLQFIYMYNAFSNKLGEAVKEALYGNTGSYEKSSDFPAMERQLNGFKEVFGETERRLKNTNNPLAFHNWSIPSVFDTYGWISFFPKGHALDGVAKLNFEVLFRDENVLVQITCRNDGLHYALVSDYLKSASKRDESFVFQEEVFAKSRRRITSITHPEGVLVSEPRNVIVDVIQANLEELYNEFYQDFLMAVGTIVEEIKPTESSLFKPERLGQDHYYATPYDEPIDGYEKIGTVFHVLDKQKVGQTVPLRRFFTEKNQNHFYCIDPSKEKLGLYTEKSSIGYVHPSTVDPGIEAGLVPLYRYYNGESKDHFYTIIQAPEEFKKDGYGYHGVECYVWDRPVKGSVPIELWVRGMSLMEREKEDEYDQSVHGINADIASRNEEPLGSEERPVTTQPQLHDTKRQLLSDVYAENDLLNYSAYAESIVEIINDDFTVPPVSIAILAPWGQGKTTLMHLIEKKLIEKTESKMDKADFINSTNHATFADLKSWLHSEKLTFPDLKQPTIWFNPWEYQSSEQIWAGMGHAIITQLVQKLSPFNQQQFWFSLNLKRLDKHALKQSVYKRLFEKLIPTLILFGLAVAGTIILLVYDFVGTGWSVGGIASAASVFSAIWNRNKLVNESLDGSFSKYVKAPNYEEKLGVYHYINEDLSRVFELLDEKSPAVIFIDDLDRCSPDKITEVVEAINIIMNGEWGKKCYFILGMDAQMVAAALDISYKSMIGKIKTQERSHGSVGWYFLDKIIQLPFFIPVMSNETKEGYLASLFDKKQVGNSDRSARRVLNGEEDAEKKERAIQAAKKLVVDGELSSEERKEISQEFAGGYEHELDTALVKEGMQQIKADSHEIQEALEAFSKYLSPTPRSIKRFANLLRFYSVHQFNRRMKGEEQYADTETLTKWLVISVRWPQLIRWLQWEREERLIRSTNSVEKAEHLDKLVRSLKSKKFSDTTYEKWCKQFEELDTNEIEWLMDRDLLRILCEKKTTESELIRAFECGVW